MPEIEIRPVIAEDIPLLASLHHHSQTDYVWQMDFQNRREDNEININFRKNRLPRTIRLEYPRSPHTLQENWMERAGILVAVLAGRPIGYAALSFGFERLTTWVTDLVVHRPLRRQGIGSALLLAAMEWAMQAECSSLVLEMQTKNDPAIRLATKLGFDFCGYQDHQYANHETAIFFGKRLR